MHGVHFVSFALLCAAAAAALGGATSIAPPRRLFSVYVYHEEALQSSGYNNVDNLGCGVFTNASATTELVK